MRRQQMAKSGKAASTHEVLRYHPKPANRSTVRRHYAKWRQEQGITPHCDNPGCTFHSQPLVWDGKPLPLILDHVNGNNRDNRPKNLRYLCPNCDSQLFTRGGANKGRVEEACEGKYVLVSRDGRREYVLIAEPASIRISGGLASLVVKRASDAE